MAEPLKLECLLLGFRFFCIYEKSGENKAIDLMVSQLPPAEPGCLKSHSISTQPYSVQLSLKTSFTWQFESLCLIFIHLRLAQVTRLRQMFEINHADLK